MRERVNGGAGGLSCRPLTAQLHRKKEINPRFNSNASVAREMQESRSLLGFDEFRSAIQLDTKGDHHDCKAFRECFWMELAELVH